ncbi:MrcB family domain-containing protein [Arthrobacter sp. 162MFSha1.1]|uniref:MrcB family domain-containing protein n=1 Tax=Arthrobacter sp. 162MFSha1.1 TaxID=1151119 RepID=UPI0018C8FA10|nr:DUF3578 domain-containing protein [Arthrobacter sp. 162MFSha1.1]
MDIRTYIQQIAAGYHTDSVHSEGHVLLSRATVEEVLKPVIPAGLLVRGSGGQGRPTPTPWIAILDPDETRTLQRGIYLVWIFSNDRSEIVLSLNQGITELQAQLGWSALLPVVKAEAERLRRGLRADLSGLTTDIDIGRKKRQRGYGAANIVAKTYSVARLPPESQLLSDLRRMVALYQEAIGVKRRLTVTKPGALNTATPAQIREPGEGDVGFKPKSRADYQVRMQAATQHRRGDRHEVLLTEYAAIAARLGHIPRNRRVHPRDLTLNVSGQEWLVEAKVVYDGNATHAVRAAIGQLMEYAHLFYEDGSRPRLMALFTEPIGAVFVGLLESLNIAVVWKGEGSWEGSELAAIAGLV